jgi:RNA polymerase sigma-70 factor (ECF subfamily)
LLQHSRRDARTDADGEVVLIGRQDRSQWHRDEIAEGIALTERALHMTRRPGRYALEAAIAAVHAQAATADDTDWWQIAALYEVLLRVSPSPMAALSRSVAVSMAQGPAAGLALADSIAAEGSLAHSHLLHATRADMLGSWGAHRRRQLPTAPRSTRRATRRSAGCCSGSWPTCPSRHNHARPRNAPPGRLRRLRHVRDPGKVATTRHIHQRRAAAEHRPP